MKYRCKKCQHQFHMDDDVPFCPACDCEDVDGTYYRDCSDCGGSMMMWDDTTLPFDYLCVQCLQ
ncbi:hypothetical protein LCGC14_2402000, partial [marine sediment metagenome]